MNDEPVIDITGNKYLPMHMRAETSGSRLMCLRYMADGPRRRSDGRRVAYMLVQRELSGVPKPGSGDVCCVKGEIIELWSRRELEEAGLLDRSKPMFESVVMMF